LLDKQKKTHEKRFLKTLSSLLITPDSFLLSVPSYRIAPLITQFFAVIGARETEIVAHHCLPFPKKTGTLVLISSPDASYLIDSLKALQESQDLTFEIMAHHVLMIKRQGQKIIDLRAGSELGPKESLIILKLEETDKEYLQNLTARIEKIFSAALNVQRHKESLAVQLSQLEQTSVFQPWKNFIGWLQ